ncbi:MAG TPA: DUF732 domain-containing protein [Mycobacterium sp.]|nr:DUF732 domain-containing protein [Mycobacterium sp.]
MWRRTLTTTVGCLLSGLSLIGPAGLAYADDPDQRFLAALSADGISGDPGRLIATGREVCDWQNLPHDENSWSPYAEKRAAITRDLIAQGLSMPQSKQFTRDAIEVYCPERKTW